MNIVVKNFKDPNKNFWLGRLLPLVKNAPENGTRFKVYKMGNTKIKWEDANFKWDKAPTKQIELGIDKKLIDRVDKDGKVNLRAEQQLEMEGLKLNQNG